MGGSDGLLALYEKADSKDNKGLYVRSDRKLFLADAKGHVTSLLATSKEDQLFVGISSGVIFRLSLDKNE